MSAEWGGVDWVAHSILFCFYFVFILFYFVLFCFILFCMFFENNLQLMSDSQIDDL
jgi:hypothetical protein